MIIIFDFRVKMAAINSFQNLELHLAQKLFTLKPNENAFFSTYSIIQALALLLINHEKLNQSERAHLLNLPWSNYLQISENELDSIEKITIKLANVIYADKTLTLKDEVFQSIAKTKNSKIENLDFKNDPEVSRLLINDFVAKNTNDLIKDLLPMNSVGSDTASVLVNCIYFYGNWLKPFENRATRPMAWFGSKDSKFDAMSQKNNKLMIMRDNQKFPGYEMARIPYTERIGFYVILDREAKSYDQCYKNLVSGVDNNRIRQKSSEDSLGILNHFQAMKAETRSGNDGITLILPKFNFSSSLKPKEVLEKLGVPMRTNGLAIEPLEVDDVIHKAVIKVDEKGTEAAAATAMEWMAECWNEPLPPFIVDRPFLFVIYDDLAEKMLFTGYLQEPEKWKLNKYYKYYKNYFF